MSDLAPYLAACDVIDHEHPAVRELAAALRRANERDVRSTIAACFEHVRDRIEHCIDAGRTELTCNASEVLRVGTGFCYAKSHLLVALLRACGVPAGLCYQRLTWSDDDPRHVLHGLAAVWLPPHGWVRVDPRGNRAGIDARFEPPAEHLAFPVRPELGEVDAPGVWAEPWRCVVGVLRAHGSVAEALPHLPDLPSAS